MDSFFFKATTKTGTTETRMMARTIKEKCYLTTGKFPKK